LRRRMIPRVEIERLCETGSGCQQPAPSHSVYRDSGERR
jgi:hypothetical protein